MASSFMTGELAETECTQLGGHGYHTVETRKWPAAAAQRLLVGAEDWAQTEVIHHYGDCFSPQDDVTRLCECECGLLREDMGLRTAL